MEYRINIAEPCHENWNEMTPEDTGRHCAQCCKTVVDFTNWSVDEISAYLFATRKESTCGRFTAKQLEQDYLTPDTYIYQLQHSGLSFLKRIAALILFVFCLDTAAFAQQKKIPQQTEQNSKIKGRVQPVLMGKPAVRQVNRHAQDTIKKQNEETPPMVMGIIAMPQKPDTTQKVKGRVRTTPAKR